MGEVPGVAHSHLPQMACNMMNITRIGLRRLNRIQLALHAHDRDLRRSVEAGDLLTTERCATHRLQCRVRRAGSRQEGRVVPGRLGHGLLGARTRPGAQQAIDARRRAQRPFRQHRGLQPQVLNDRSGDDSAAQGPQRQRVRRTDGHDRRGHRRLLVRQRPRDLPAQARSDDNGPLVPQGSHDGGHVGGQGHQVVARWRPVRTAEAPQIRGGDAVAGLSQGADDVPPRPPAFGEAVNKQNQGLRRTGVLDVRVRGGGELLVSGEGGVELGSARGEVAMGPGAGAIDDDGHQGSLNDRLDGCGPARRAPTSTAFRCTDGDFSHLSDLYPQKDARNRR